MSDGKPKRAPVAPQKLQARRKADLLVRDTGIPPHLALQVANGQITLKEVLERMALRDQVDGLMRRHDLPRSVAMQVALGQVELEAVLARKRMDAHFASYGGRSIFDEALASGAALGLAVHGRQMVSGAVVAVDRYELQVRVEGEAAPRTVHKATVKWACPATETKLIRNTMRRDKERDRDCEPIWKPQDRFGCSDRRLFGYHDEGTPITVTLLEGELFTGTVEYVARWEFGLRLQKKHAMVVVFRHALADVREV